MAGAGRGGRDGRDARRGQSADCRLPDTYGVPHSARSVGAVVRAREWVQRTRRPWPWLLAAGCWQRSTGADREWDGCGLVLPLGARLIRAYFSSSVLNALFHFLFLISTKRTSASTASQNSASGPQLHQISSRRPLPASGSAARTDGQKSAQLRARSLQIKEHIITDRSARLIKLHTHPAPELQPLFVSRTVTYISSCDKIVRTVL